MLELCTLDFAASSVIPCQSKLSIDLLRFKLIAANHAVSPLALVNKVVFYVGLAAYNTA